MTKPLIPQFFLQTLTYLCMSLILTGCIDLSGSRSTYIKKELQQPHKNSAHTNRGEVHTMRGGLGIFSIGMNQLRDSVSAQYKIPAQSTMWYNAGEVSRYIINNYYKNNNHAPIILIGHSLGANEQIKVARNLNTAGIPVALLVTVDAVSQTIIPPNVKHALNLYKPGFVPMFSGLKLRAVDSQATQIDNINVATWKTAHVNHFTIDKDKAVQALIMNEIKKVLKDGNKKSA